MPRKLVQKSAVVEHSPTAAAGETSTGTGTKTTQSRKRKMGGDMTKFYAVRAGHEPGVYMTWKECQAQTTGFKGASYKSFLTYQEAADFAAGRVTPSTAGPPKFYGVAVGREPGVYTEWTRAQEAFAGTKGPKYKKFETREEAEDYVRRFGTSKFVDSDEEDDGEHDDLDDDDDDDDDEDEDEAARPTKKIKVAIKQKGQRPHNGALVIYTDGSSLKNGQHGARAGVGVFFGPGDERNLSERLRGEPQTNQRAELTALLRALQVAGAGQEVEIRSDSKYSIQCVTEWYVNWEKNDWTTSTRAPVRNKDLVQAIRHEMDTRDARGTKTRFQWVKGHASDPGNIAADRLAVAGASMGV